MSQSARVQRAIIEATREVETHMAHYQWYLQNGYCNDENAQGTRSSLLPWNSAKSPRIHTRIVKYTSRLYQRWAEILQNIMAKSNKC